MENIVTTGRDSLGFQVDGFDIASQITRNFTTPLEIYREAIANAYDHHSKRK